MVAGSYLALSHGTNDGQQDWTEFRAIYGRAGIEGTLRTRAQVEALFGDFELVEPGVVWIPLWRPESPDDVFYEDPESSAIYAAVGRKR